MLTRIQRNITKMDRKGLCVLIFLILSPKILKELSRTFGARWYLNFQLLRLKQDRYTFENRGELIKLYITYTIHSILHTDMLTRIQRNITKRDRKGLGVLIFLILSLKILKEFCRAFGTRCYLNFQLLRLKQDRYIFEKRGELIKLYITYTIRYILPSDTLICIQWIITKRDPKGLGVLIFLILSLKILKELSRTFGARCYLNFQLLRLKQDRYTFQNRGELNK